jgi:hypothetical protein
MELSSGCRSNGDSNLLQSYLLPRLKLRHLPQPKSQEAVTISQIKDRLHPVAQRTAKAPTCKHSFVYLQVSNIMLSREDSESV